MPKAKVSVIIPVHNSEQYLEECLDSVIKQSLKDIEIVCVNDGSTDNSLKILNKYAKNDNRFIILDETNQGAGISRKKGLYISNGEYVAFVDADDILNTKYFELAYKNGKKNNSEIVLFKAKYFDTSKKKEFLPDKYDLSKFFPKDTNFDKFTFNWKDVKPLVFNTFSNIWACLFESNFLKSNDFYFPKKLSFNDVPIHVQSVLTANRLSFVPEPLYYYRLFNEGSITNVSHSNKKVFDFFEINHFIEDYLISKDLLDEFRQELIQFRLEHFTYHLNKIDKSEKAIIEKFFKLVKKEFLKFKLNENEFELLSDFYKIRFLSKIDSSSYSEYLTRVKLYSSKIRSFDKLINEVKFSVIYPILDKNNFSKEYFEILVNQSLKNIEIICVCDKLDTVTLNILKDYTKKDKRIHIFELGSEKLSNLLSKVLSKSSGEFIYFLDNIASLDVNYLETFYNSSLLNESNVSLIQVLDNNNNHKIISKKADGKAILSNLGIESIDGTYASFINDYFLNNFGEDFLTNNKSSIDKDRKSVV